MMMTLSLSGFPWFMKSLIHAFVDSISGGGSWNSHDRHEIRLPTGQKKKQLDLNSFPFTESPGFVQAMFMSFLTSYHPHIIQSSSVFGHIILMMTQRAIEMVSQIPGFQTLSVKDVPALQFANLFRATYFIETDGTVSY